MNEEMQEKCKKERFSFVESLILLEVPSLPPFLWLLILITVPSQICLGIKGSLSEWDSTDLD